MYETKKCSTLHLMECLVWTLHTCGKMRFIVPSVGHIVPSCRVMATPDSRCRLVSFGTLNNSWYYALCCEQWQNMIMTLIIHYTDCTVMYKLILNASEYYYCYFILILLWSSGKGKRKGRPRKVNQRLFIDGGWWISFPWCFTLNLVDLPSHHHHHSRSPYWILVNLGLVKVTLW